MKALAKFIGLFLVVIVAAVGLAQPPRAQMPNTIQCGSFDTSTYSTTAMAALGVCDVTTGPYGVVYAVGSSEGTCAVDAKTQILIAAGTSPVNGANFFGSVSSGTLTVTQMIAGGIAPWTIQTGQILSGNETNVTQTTITGQLTQYSVSNSSLSWSGGVVTVATSSPHQQTNLGNTVIVAGATPSGYNGTFTVQSAPDTTHYTYGLVSNPGAATVTGTTTATPGSVGTYSTANGGLSYASTNLYTLNPIPGGMTDLSRVMTQSACAGSGFLITTLAGVFKGTPRSPYYIVQSLYSTAGGRVAWNNASIVIFTY